MAYKVNLVKKERRKSDSRVMFGGNHLRNNNSNIDFESHLEEIIGRRVKDTERDLTWMIFISQSRDNFIFYRCVAMFTSRREKFMEVQVAIDFSFVLVKCNVFLQSIQPRGSIPKRDFRIKTERGFEGVFLRAGGETLGSVILQVRCCRLHSGNIQGGNDGQWR